MYVKVELKEIKEKVMSIKYKKNFRTKVGKKAMEMTAYDAVALAEGFAEGTEEEQLTAWQYLVDTGLAWTLQGWFGRTAEAMINAGVIQPKTA